MQEAYSFDKETLKKIGRGALISVVAPAVVALLDYIGQIHFHSQNPGIDYLLIYFIPVLVNAGKEYIKGVPKE
jgi:hypothetical protein